MTTQEQLQAWEKGRAELSEYDIWISGYELIIAKLRAQLEAEKAEEAEKQA